MKNIVKTIVITSALLSTHNLKAEESYSLGLGFGVLYSGLGTNISVRSDNDMKYLSAGLLSYSSIYGATYGAGIGWIKTDLFNASTNKHGVGLYLGAVGTEVKYRDRDAVYGAGISYHYFFNGIDKPGTTIGLSASYGKGDFVDGSVVMLELGYQF